MRRRLTFIALLLAALFLMGMSLRTRLRTPTEQRDWLQFTSSPVAIAITRNNVANLSMQWRVQIPEPCDGSPLFVGPVLANNGIHNLLILQTIAGRLIALDAADGSVVWQTTPPAGVRWTTSSPAIEPSLRSVFAYALDGSVHQYEIATGNEVTGHGFPALITTKGDVEKGSSSISIATAANGETYLYMTTAGYPDPGDAGDYQGHLVAINLTTGTQHVFNALCSDRPVHFSESGGADDCADVQAGIWARAGAVFDPETDRLFITIGNGPFNADRGGFNWGTSVVALRPDGRTDGGAPVDSYTPANYQELTDDDLDLSSTTIEPLPVNGQSDWPRLGVQSGKDSRLRLLNLENLSGQGGPRHLGGELQIVDVPQGGEVMTQPAAWLDPATGRTWIIVADNQGTTAWELTNDNGSPRLTRRWSSSVPGTTPIISNGVLYLASPHQIAALRPTTGAILWQDHSIGDTHWQNPIVVNDHLYIADNANTITAYALNGGR